MDSFSSLSKSQRLFVKIIKLNILFIQNFKGHRIGNSILKWKNRFGGLTFFCFTTHYNAKIITTIWYWHKCRHADHFESIGRESKHLWSIDFHGEFQDNSMGKEKSFEQMVQGQLDITCKRMKLEPYLTSCTKLTQNVQNRKSKRTYYWKKAKQVGINRKTSFVHGLEYLLLLG